MFSTFSYYVAMFYRNFMAYTSGQLQALGLSFGLLYFIIYVGKYPGCSQVELTRALGVDWGYSQRSVIKLVEEGFLTREKEGRVYRLHLSEKGQEAYAIAHQVFFEWDDQMLKGLAPTEQKQLHALMEKAAQGARGNLGTGSLKDR